MCRLNRFCCGLSLQTGVLFALGADWILCIKELFDLLNLLEYCIIKDFQCGMLRFVLVSFMTIVKLPIISRAIFGVERKQPSCLAPYLILRLVWLCLIPIVIIANFSSAFWDKTWIQYPVVIMMTIIGGAFENYYPYYFGLVNFIISIVVFAAILYSTIVIYSYYKNLIEELARGGGRLIGIRPVPLSDNGHKEYITNP